MNTKQILFALTQNVIRGETVDDTVVSACTPEMLENVYKLAARYDLAHLIGQAVSKLDLPESEAKQKCTKAAMAAFVRHMRLDFDRQQTCQVLENAKIPFLPLKGSVLQALYPEPWLRTSCDVDILVRREDLEKAVNILVDSLSYKRGVQDTHDVVLQTPSGSYIELHFDLVEEGRANSAKAVLCKVWETATLRDGSSFWFELPDAYIYFYHIAHMAKHFETGGCGIRPFIDLWLLENRAGGDPAQRIELLKQGNLLQFAQATVKLSCVWLDSDAPDPLSQKMEDFLLRGGSFGSVSNRVALHQKARGGSFTYIISRIFAPYEKLKSYYPILEKHRWLTPVMQVRRWLLLLRPSVARMAKSELAANRRSAQQGVDDTSQLLAEIGIQKSSW